MAAAPITGRMNDIHAAGPAAGRRRGIARGPPPETCSRSDGGTFMGYITSNPIMAMKPKVIVVAGLLTAVCAGSTFAAAPATAKPASRVSVVFVEPQKFTDLKRDSWGDYSPDLAGQLQAFMQETGERYVPVGMHLVIKVTDVDLAGEFEPQLGPRFDDIRMVRAIYPPRIKLEFSLTDAKGTVLNSGSREITDLAFQMRTAWPADDYLRYEKEILRDWFSAEFGRVAKN
jgi:hypothetical protein